MPDILMCTNTTCPLAPSCYRVQAKRSDWQWYSNFEYTVSSKGVVCEDYLLDSRKHSFYVGQLGASK